MFAIACYRRDDVAIVCNRRTLIRIIRVHIARVLQSPAINVLNYNVFAVACNRRDDVAIARKTRLNLNLLWCWIQEKVSPASEHTNDHHDNENEATELATRVEVNHQLNHGEFHRQAALEKKAL